MPGEIVAFVTSRCSSGRHVAADVPLLPWTYRRSKLSRVQQVAIGSRKWLSDPRCWSRAQMRRKTPRGWPDHVQARRNHAPVSGLSHLTAAAQRNPAIRALVVDGINRRQRPWRSRLQNCNPLDAAHGADRRWSIAPAKDVAAPASDRPSRMKASLGLKQRRAVPPAPGWPPAQGQSIAVRGHRLSAMQLSTARLGHGEVMRPSESAVAPRSASPRLHERPAPAQHDLGLSCSCNPVPAVAVAASCALTLQRSAPLIVAELDLSSCSA